MKSVQKTLIFAIYSSNRSQNIRLLFLASKRIFAPKQKQFNMKIRTNLLVPRNKYTDFSPDGLRGKLCTEQQQRKIKTKFGQISVWQQTDSIPVALDNIYLSYLIFFGKPKKSHFKTSIFFKLRFSLWYFYFILFIFSLFIFPNLFIVSVHQSFDRFFFHVFRFWPPPPHPLPTSPNFYCVVTRTVKFSIWYFQSIRNLFQILQYYSGRCIGTGFLAF